MGVTRLSGDIQASPREREARRCLAAEPTDPGSFTELGVAAGTQGRPEDLLAWLGRALSVAPERESSHLNLAYGLLQAQVWEPAVQALRRIAALRPGDGLVLYNLGALFLRLGRFRDAVAFSGRAGAVAPDQVDARYNEAMGLLGTGDWKRGWPLYEWRWLAPSFTTPLRTQASPPWSGQPQAGTSLLVLAEQGIGDSLQFIRYAVSAAERGGRVTFACHPLLVALLRRIPRLSVVSEREALPDADFHAPLLSLPRLLGCQPPLVPTAPYLIADRDKIANWIERLSPLPQPRVGLCWRGNPRFVDDALRSPGLKPLLPIIDVPGLAFINLTKAPAVEDGPLAFFDPTGELSDFDDTAALLSTLDLVVTSDSAIAHLAGGLGRPTWLLLSAAADWRWAKDEDATPWYPSMRLFRQSRLGDWDGLTARLLTALHQWRASATGHRPGPGTSPA